MCGFLGGTLGCLSNRKVAAVNIQAQVFVRAYVFLSRVYIRKWVGWVAHLSGLYLEVGWLGCRRPRLAFRGTA